MEKNYSYEITKDGYYILINGERSIHQYEPYIPDKTKTYEENAITQIEEMKQADVQVQKDKTEKEKMQEEITDLQLAMAEIVEGGIG